MENNTIETFDKWNIITDYESNEHKVTLIDKDGNNIAEFGYSRFEQEDFIYFKNKINN